MRSLSWEDSGVAVGNSHPVTCSLPWSEPAAAAHEDHVSPSLLYFH